MPVAWVQIGYSIVEDNFWAKVNPPTTTVGFRFEGNSVFSNNTLTGGNGNDTITAKALKCSYVYGLGGNDSIVGSDAWACSLLDGGDGNDTIIGGNRADQIIGGAGNDRDYGGVADIKGDGGDDTIRFRGNGGDIFGGDGNDKINITNVAQRTNELSVDPGNGNDTLDLRGHNIVVYDSDGNDTIDLDALHSDITLQYDGGKIGRDTVRWFSHDKNDKVSLLAIEDNHDITLRFSNNINNPGDVWLEYRNQNLTILHVNAGASGNIHTHFYYSTIVQADIMI